MTTYTCTPRRQGQAWFGVPILLFAAALASVYAGEIGHANRLAMQCISVLLLMAGIGFLLRYALVSYTYILTDGDPEVDDPRLLETVDTSDPSVGGTEELAAANSMESIGAAWTLVIKRSLGTRSAAVFCAHLNALSGFETLPEDPRFARRRLRALRRQTPASESLDFRVNLAPAHTVAVFAAPLRGENRRRLLLLEPDASFAAELYRRIP